MQNIFKNKGGKFIKTKLVAEIKITIISVNMGDIHVTTQSKASEEHVFKDQKPRKNKSIIDQETKKKLKNIMVKTIQQMQIASPPPNLPAIIVGEWTIGWIKMLSLVGLIERLEIQKVPSTFPSRLIHAEEIFQNINKQMLEIGYTLNLGQLFKITLDPKKYLW